MTPRERDEYRALRATIRTRGTARVSVFLAGLGIWAGLAIATAALLPVPSATLVPLVLLAGTFESVFALHVGVEARGTVSAGVPRRRLGTDGDGVWSAARRNRQRSAVCDPVRRRDVSELPPGPGRRIRSHRIHRRRHGARAFSWAPCRRATGRPPSARGRSQRFREPLAKNASVLQIAEGRVHGKGHRPRSLAAHRVHLCR